MKEKNTLITIRSDQEFKDKVGEYANGLGLNTSALIRSLLIKEMKNDSQ